MSDVGRYAGAKADQAARFGAMQAHAGTIFFFLYRAARLGMGFLGTKLVDRVHVAGHCAASVYRHRCHCRRSYAGLGHDVDAGLDPPAGPPLANLASRRLCHCRAVGLAFLVDSSGQK